MEMPCCRRVFQPTFLILQTLGETEMREMVDAASKVVFHNKDLPNDYYYGVFKPKKQRDNLEKFFKMFTQVFCINTITGISP